MLPTEARTQEEFIKAAVQYYQSKCISSWDAGYYPIGSEGHSSKEWLYKLGRDLGILQMDYQEFLLHLKADGYRSYRKDYRRKKWYSLRMYTGRYGHFCHPKYYRVLTSFTWTGQSKKEIDKAWRIHKKFDKDKSKNRKYHDPWKRHLKHFSARNHRALERKACAAGDYDSLHSRSYKYADDPWNWD